jgi:hypothetical protein
MKDEKNRNITLIGAQNEKQINLSQLSQFERLQTHTCQVTYCQVSRHQIALSAHTATHRSCYSSAITIVEFKGCYSFQVGILIYKLNFFVVTCLFMFIIVYLFVSAAAIHIIIIISLLSKTKKKR